MKLAILLVSSLQNTFFRKELLDNLVWFVVQPFEKDCPTIFVNLLSQKDLVL